MRQRQKVTFAGGGAFGTRRPVESRAGGVDANALRNWTAKNPGGRRLPSRPRRLY
jgi:hypothetical protein